MLLLDAELAAQPQVVMDVLAAGYGLSQKERFDLGDRSNLTVSAMFSTYAQSEQSYQLLLSLGGS